ncbi:hypothetical protein [Streptomyces sp. N35]|uniref:hypothetical protein n=1 Tax=Streptomyces sp. N35 TaxID=2795730 RepID=UPI001F257EFD|nr:hypothetical protein [Streptomyces sp. N35]
MSGRAPLGRVLADLGSTFIVSTVGEPDAARPVGGVLIHDPHDAPARLPGAIVLGVGIHGAAEAGGLVEWAAVLGAAPVIVRAPIAVDEAVEAAVDKAAIPVLGLMAGASWAQVAALLRSMLSVDELVGEPAEEPLAGDLFALANAISALLDGPVTVEDRDGRVLAFSSRQDEGDEARIATILDRQVPAEKLRALEERGAFRLLYRNDEPLYLEGIAAKPRVAIAVRAGGEILGSIWVVVKQPLTRDRERALSDAAKVAALHLLRRRAGEDVGHRLRADLLATLLEGGEGAPGARPARSVRPARLRARPRGDPHLGSRRPRRGGRPDRRCARPPPERDPPEDGHRHTRRHHLRGAARHFGRGGPTGRRVLPGADRGPGVRRHRGRGGGGGGRGGARAPPARPSGAGTGRPPPAGRAASRAGPRTCAVRAPKPTRPCGCCASGDRICGPPGSPPSMWTPCCSNWPTGSPPTAARRTTRSSGCVPTTLSTARR